MLTEEGTVYGPFVGWPAVDNGEAIWLSSGVLIRRPSPSDLRKLFVEETAELSKEVAGARYRERVGQLRGRCRAKRSYLKECGLPTSREWEKLDQEIHAIDIAMRRCVKLEAIV